MNEPLEDKLKAITLRFKMKEAPKTKEEYLQRCEAEYDLLMDRTRPLLENFRSATIFRVIPAITLLSQWSLSSLDAMEKASGVADEATRRPLAEILKLACHLMSLGIEATVRGGLDGLDQEAYESLSSQVKETFEEALK